MSFKENLPQYDIIALFIGPQILNKAVTNTITVSVMMLALTEIRVYLRCLCTQSGNALKPTRNSPFLNYPIEAGFLNFHTQNNLPRQIVLYFLCSTFSSRAIVTKFNTNLFVFIFLPVSYPSSLPSSSNLRKLFDDRRVVYSTLIIRY